MDSLVNTGNIFLDLESNFEVYVNLLSCSYLVRHTATHHDRVMGLGLGTGCVFPCPVGRGMCISTTITWMP